MTKRRASAEPMRRSSRKSKRRTSASNVSSSFYVGYVEDNESVASIMKKFQSLEKLKESKRQVAARKDEKEVTLTEKDMEQLFNETSAFNMHRVLNEDYYLSEEESVFSDDESKRKRNKSSSLRGPSGKTIDYTVIPAGPLPRSWGKTIQQYTPENAIHTQTTWSHEEVTNFKTISCIEVPQGSSLVKVEDMLKREVLEIVTPIRGGFEGIVLSPPWKNRLGFSGNLTEGSIEPTDLLKLGLGSNKLMKAGFIYVWTPKHWVAKLIKVMGKLNFFYVENGIIVRQTTNNHLEHEACAKYTGQVLKVSHELLLIFRKGYIKKSGKREWTKVEIRHQRTSDVGFAYFGKDNEYKYVSDYVYNLVETMVPLGRLNPNSEGSKKSKGRLLHLWGHSEHQRSGWVHVAEKQD